MSMLEASDRYDIPQTNLAGYLYKRSSNGDWQRRYFEINGSYLTYYKSQKMTKLLAALSIPQVGAIKMVGETDEGVEFRIDIKDRQYLLRASSYSEAQTWVSTLQKVRNSSGGSNPMNSHHHHQQRPVSTTSTSSEASTATVQKSVRNGCLSCLRRTFH